MKKEAVNRYSQAFKLQVVREYEAGASIYSLLQKYGEPSGPGGSGTVKRWIEKYAHSGYRHEVVHIQCAADHEHVQAMKCRMKELESALAQSTLDNRMLEATLEVAGQELGMDLKKKFAPRSSST